MAAEADEHWLTVVHTETLETQRLAAVDPDLFIPEWSPDGGQLLFQKDWDIYVIDADGSNQTNLSDSGGTAYGAQWSADGHSVYYTSWDDNRRIVEAGLDGSSRYLTPEGSQFLLPSPRPAWDRERTTASGTGFEIQDPRSVGISAPDNTFFEDTQLELEALDTIPATAPFEQANPGYRISAVSRTSGYHPVTVDLPQGEAGTDAAVLFHSLGQWIRLPSEPVRLDSGEPGLRVQIEGVPFPWLLTVAEAPAGTDVHGLAKGDDWYAQAARLEQLRITDQGQFLAAEGEHWEAGGESSQAPWTWFGWMARPAAAADGAGGEAAAQLQQARLMFLRAYAEVRRQEGSSRTANQRYLDGLQYLRQAARTVAGLDERDQQERSFADTAGSDQRLQGFERDHVYGGELSLRDMAEYYLGTFAPWGLRLTLAILEGEDQALLPEFDLRVLPFFGQEAHLDIHLPGDYTGAPGYHRHLPTVEYFQRQVRDALEIREGSEQITASLRLYSPRIYDYSSNEYYSLIQNSIGGASYLYGLAQLAGGPATMGTGAAVYAGYSVVAPLIEAAFVKPRAEELAEAGIASPSTTLSAYSVGKLLGKVVLDPSEASLPLSAVDYVGELTDVVMHYMIDHAEQRELERLRRQGSDTGYRNAAAWFWQGSRFPVPPMAFVINVDGPTTLREEQESGQYTLSGHGQFEMFVDYQSLPLARESVDLSQKFVREEFSRETEQRLQDGIVFAVSEDASVTRRDDLLGLPVRSPLDWTEHVEDWATMHHYDEAPCGKLLTFSLEEDLLDRWAGRGDYESTEEWMEHVAVELSPSSGGREIALFTSGGQNVANSLANLYQPNQGGEGRLQFGLAISEYPTDLTSRGEAVILGNLGPDSVGEFSDWVWYSPVRQQFSLRYQVELRYDEEVLDSFVVDYSGLGPSVERKTVEPSGGLSHLPERTLHSLAYHPDWEEDYVFAIVTHAAEHFRTHSEFVLAVEEESGADLDRFNFSWSAVSDQGAPAAIAPEQQGGPVAELELAFEEDHPHEAEEPAEGSSPFDVEVPYTHHTITVEITDAASGEHVATVEQSRDVPGPYQIEPYGM